MPFHLINSLPSKYSSIESQKHHEYEYKKFLKTLPRNTSESKLCKHQEIYFNNNYLTQRQINLQYRQDKRKHEYERIQKENWRFTQRLINAKPSLNRNEQQTFFEKHSKLKQRLQHYPDFTLKSTLPRLLKPIPNPRKAPDISLSVFHRSIIYTKHQDDQKEEKAKA